jgi:AraC-like DNA-binding protein
MTGKLGQGKKPHPTHVSKQTSRYELNLIARLLIDRITSCNIPLAPILSQIKVFDTPAKIVETGGSDLSGHKVSMLCRELHHALVNHMYGRFFDFEARMEENKFACYALTGCANLGEAIKRIEIFNHMLKASTVDVRNALTHDRVSLIVTAATVGDDLENNFLNNVLALRAWMKLLSWLIGENIQPTGASMSCLPPAEPHTATALLSCEVAFAQRDDLLEFPASYLKRAIVRNYSDMVEFLSFFPYNFDTDDSHVGTLAEHIRNIYQTALTMHEPLPDVWQLAQNFGLSPSTFKRRLAEEGISAGAVKDEWRRARAIQELTTSTRTIDDIAEGLGFSCSKTFRRAFFRWTNTSPTKFRSGEGRPASELSEA